MTSRLTVKKLVEETGLCRETIRKYADSGAIPSARDVNNWRIFPPKSVEIAKKLFGIKIDR